MGKPIEFKLWLFRYTLTIVIYNTDQTYFCRKIAWVSVMPVYLPDWFPDDPGNTVQARTF